MELYGQYDKSISQKIIIHAIEIILLIVSWWILWGDGGPWVSQHLGISNAVDGSPRRTIIFAFHIVTFLRFSYMMFFLLNRSMPWEECVSVPFAFALYYVGFSVLVLPTRGSIDLLDFLAILIFISGCVLNTGGELLRKKWKVDPRNKGKIYTVGFFRYSRHINYFGDLLWVTGYAILTGNIWSATIPIFLFCFFVFYNVPKLDEYLKQKYGEDYDVYAKTTKSLIPYIY